MSLAPMRSDTELVGAAAGGDQSAWNELIDRYGRLVYANARAAGADPTLANDVGQVVWMRLLHRLDTIREPERIKGWLAIVSRNAALELLRRRRPEDSLDGLADLADHPDHGVPTPERTAEHNSDVTALGRALRRLSDKCRELITLLYGAQMSYDEINATTGMPIGSIGPTRQRCLDRLRSFMEA